MEELYEENNFITFIRSIYYDRTFSKPFKSLRDRGGRIFQRDRNYRTHGKMGADLFEIEPVHKYTDADLNWHDKKSLTTIECNDPKSRPAIANKIDISSYDTVILCYPIWWAYAPKIVYTFVESQNWSGKNLITLCTSGGSGLGRSGSDLAKFANGSNFKGGKDFTRGSGVDVKNYVEGLK